MIISKFKEQFKLYTIQSHLKNIDKNEVRKTY